MTRDAGGTYLPGYFRTAHNDLFQGAMGAQFAVEVLKAGSVATIHDGDPYTEGLAVVMANTFAGMNGDVVFQGAVSKGDTDMSSDSHRDRRQRSGCRLPAGLHYQNPNLSFRSW